MDSNPSSKKLTDDAIWGPSIPRVPLAPEILIISPSAQIAHQLRTRLTPSLGELESARIPSPFGEFACDRSGKVGLLSHFVGAPAAALNLEPLLMGGTTRIILSGPIGALTVSASDQAIGDIVQPSRALSDDGTSRHYLATARKNSARTDIPLIFAEAESAGDDAVITVDAPYRETEGWCRAAHARGARFVDMESAAVLTLAAQYGVPCYGIFVVSDIVGPKSGDTAGLSFRTPQFRSGVEKLVGLIAAHVSNYFRR